MMTVTVERITVTTDQPRPYAELIREALDLVRQAGESEKQLLRQTAELRRVYRMPEVP